jgi:hypothetical protein
MNNVRSLIRSPFQALPMPISYPYGSIGTKWEIFRGLRARKLIHTDWKNPEDLSKFRASIRNIVEYGIDERLTVIKEALRDLLRRNPDWD